MVYIIVFFDLVRVSFVYLCHMVGRRDHLHTRPTHIWEKSLVLREKKSCVSAYHTILQVKME